MKHLTVTLALALITGGCTHGSSVTSKLPLKRVVIYRNGVGYFERTGNTDEPEVAFQMRQSGVGDFLATLAVVERGGSSVRSASFPIAVTDKFAVDDEPKCAPKDASAAEKARERHDRNPLRNVTLHLDGKKHDLTIGYVAETPVWRPSYRVVINGNGRAELQSWGVVQNLSGEDWKNVELVLVAGAPLAFVSTLGTPVTPERPVVNDAGEMITAVPESITSLGNKAHAETNRYVPDEQASPPAGAALEVEASKADRDEKQSLTKATADQAFGAQLKRKSFAKLEEQMAAASPAGLSAPRNVGLLAGIEVQSGTTRFSIPYRVTVPNDNATMVLLGSEQIPGESVFLFAPDGGVTDSVRYSFRVARFTNSTKGHLERGPIAIFEKGSFLGQGMLQPLPTGATTTVPFALDRGVAVEQAVRYDQRGARLYKVENGQLTVERDNVTFTTYKATNGTNEAIKLLVRHTRRNGTRLFRPPVGTEDNAAQGNAVVPIAIPANGHAELVVDERQAEDRYVEWLDQLADEAVKSFLADPRSSRDAVAPLDAAWKIRQAWKHQADERDKLVAERTELKENLSEMSRSLKAIEKNANAGDLRQKLTKRLGEAATRIDQITKRLIELEVGMREQGVRFRDAINGLKILSPPPPKDA